MTRILTGLAAGLLVALPASADLTGKTAPDAIIKASWNAKGERSLEDFKGRVILLEVFATW